MVHRMSEETWTSEDEAKWQAAQPIIRKRARLYMKQRRDSGRVRKYSRSERKSSILRNNKRRSKNNVHL